MKRTIILFLLLSMVATLASCGKHEHSFGEWKTVKEASCDEEGTREKKCKCGEKETETIPKISHVYNYEITKKATYAERGERVGTCAFCGVKTTESIDCLYSDWRAVAVVDKFGDATGRTNVCATFSGTYHYYSESNSGLSVSILIPTYIHNGVFFNLYRSGGTQITKYSYENVWLNIKYQDGTTDLFPLQSDDSGAFFVDSRYSTTRELLFEGFMNKNPVNAVIEIYNSGSTTAKETMKFNLNTNGLKEIYNSSK